MAQPSSNSDARQIWFDATSSRAWASVSASTSTATSRSVKESSHRPMTSPFGTQRLTVPDLRGEIRACLCSEGRAVRPMAGTARRLGTHHHKIAMSPRFSRFVLDPMLPGLGTTDLPQPGMPAQPPTGRARSIASRRCPSRPSLHRKIVASSSAVCALNTMPSRM
jgi:hypothetical protein